MTETIIFAVGGCVVAAALLCAIVVMATMVVAGRNK